MVVANPTRSDRKPRRLAVLGNTNLGKTPSRQSKNASLLCYINLNGSNRYLYASEIIKQAVKAVVCYGDRAD